MRTPIAADRHGLASRSRILGPPLSVRWAHTTSSGRFTSRSTFTLLHDLLSGGTSLCRRHA